MEGTLHAAPANGAIRMIAVDMDGTLLGEDGQVSPRNFAALLAAEAAGIDVVIATGRRHSYAMHILRPLGLPHATALVSSNGTITRTLGCRGAEPIASQLIARAHLPPTTALWLCAHLDEFRNSLVLTFDRVGPDGEDTRGALVVEHIDELNASIGRWMLANEPYIARIDPIEDAIDPGRPDADAPIQMMLCGTVERMARAEACLLECPGVSASGHPSGRSGATMNGSAGPPSAPSTARSYRDGVGRLPLTAPSSWAGSSSLNESEPLITLHRTEYPGRDLSILDILPAGCSKGSAVLSLAAARGIAASQILAIGDNWNDVSMLEVAGAAVLMDNAPEDLKALARARGWRLGPSNRADGVADAIEGTLTVTC